MRTVLSRRRLLQNAFATLGCSVFGTADTGAEELGTVHDFTLIMDQEAKFDKPERICGLSFNADGSRLAIRDMLGGVSLFETSTKRKVRDYEIPLAWTDQLPRRFVELPFTFSPDGKQIAVSKPKLPLMKLGDRVSKEPRGVIVVREVETGRLVYERIFPEHQFPDVAIGRKLVMSFGGEFSIERDAQGKNQEVHETVRVWDRASGAEKSSYTPRVPPPLPPPIHLVNDPLSRGYGGYPNNRPNSKREAYRTPYVSMSADVQRVVRMRRVRYVEADINKDKAASLVESWDAAAGRYQVRYLQRGTQLLALSPDGETFATIYCARIPDGGYDESMLPPDKTIQICRFGDCSIVTEIPFKDDLPYYLCYAPEGDRLVTATRSGSVSVWDLKQSQLIKRFPGVGKGVRAVAVLPNGLRVACGWRTPDAKEVKLGKRPMAYEIEAAQRLEIWDGKFD